MKTEIHNQILALFTDFVLPTTTHRSPTESKKKKGEESLQTCWRSYALEFVYPVFIAAVKKKNDYHKLCDLKKHKFTVLHFRRSEF